MTTNGTTETANGTVQNVVTDLDVALANKVIVSDIENATVEAKQVASTPSKMQLVNNDIATPTNIRIHELSSEVPIGNFKVLGNKIFLDQFEFNNTAAAT